MALYVEAIEGFDALDPPEALTELDSAIRDWLGSLLAAEQERAAFAATIGTTVEMDQIWEGPATQAVVAAEEEGSCCALPPKRNSMPPNSVKRSPMFRGFHPT